MYRKTPLFLILAAAALAGCGSDDPDPLEPAPAESAFQIDLDGAVVERVTGPAYFGTDTDDDGNTVFALVLGTDTSRHVMIAVRPGSSRPVQATYALVTPESGLPGWTFLHLIGEGDELVGMFVARRGTLTVTESTAEVVRGTITYEADGFMGEESATLSGEGSFTALRATGIAALAAARRAS